jgi:hypothetical protein
MYEQYLQNDMYVKVIFCIELKSKRGFEKGDMHVVITIESTTIVSSLFLNMSWFPCFHMDTIKEFIIFF